MVVVVLSGVGGEDILRWRGWWEDVVLVIVVVVVVVWEERDRTMLVRGMRRRAALGGTQRVGLGGIVSRRSLVDWVNGRGKWFAPRLL